MANDDEDYDVSIVKKTKTTTKVTFTVEMELLGDKHHDFDHFFKIRRTNLIEDYKIK